MLVRRTDSVDLVARRDAGGALRVVRTAEGFILAEGDVAQPGVLTYPQPDGTVRRELVLPEDLHDADSLQTLARKVVTLEHPPDGADVVPDNVSALSVGDVDGDVRVTPEGRVRVALAVRRSDAIRAIESRTAVELSPGYVCRLDMTPGVHPVYGAYDAIQRARAYNHVALTARARGGRDLHLRLDSGVSMLLIQLLALLGIRRDDASAPTDADASAALARVAEMQAQLRDALPAAASVGELRAQIVALQAQATALEAQLAAAELAAASPPAEVVVPMVEQAIESAPLATTDGASPEQARMDSIRRVAIAAASERASLTQLAAQARMDSSVTALGTSDLRRAIVLHLDPTARQDGSPDYYRAYLDAQSRRRDSNPYAGEPVELRRDASVVIEESPSAEAARILRERHAARRKV